MKEQDEKEILRDYLGENLPEESEEERITRSIKILVKILIAVEQSDNNKQLKIKTTK